MADEGMRTETLRGHHARLKRRHVQLVQRTFAEVSRDPEMAAAYFYDELFRRAPETRAMFDADMDAQRATFMAALEAAVTGIEDAEALFSRIAEQGRRQVSYGVRPYHYAEVGEALIWALEQGLGDGFTDETREAWTRVYELISQVMIESSSEGPAPKADGAASLGWTSRAMS